MSGFITTPASATTATGGSLVLRDSNGDTAVRTLTVNDLQFAASETTASIVQAASTSGAGNKMIFQAQESNSPGTNAAGDFQFRMGTNVGSISSKFSISDVTGALNYFELSHQPSSVLITFPNANPNFNLRTGCSFTCNDGGTGLVLSNQGGVGGTAVTLKGLNVGVTTQLFMPTNAVATTSGAISLDCTLSGNHSVGVAANLTGTVTISLANARDGAQYTIEIKDSAQTINWSGVTDGATYTAAGLRTLLGSNVRAIVTLVSTSTGVYFKHYEGYAS